MLRKNGRLQILIDYPIGTRVQMPPLIELMISRYAQLVALHQNAGAAGINAAIHAYTPVTLFIFSAQAQIYQPAVSIWIGSG